MPKGTETINWPIYSHFLTVATKLCYNNVEVQHSLRGIYLM